VTGPPRAGTDDARPCRTLLLEPIMDRANPPSAHEPAPGADQADAATPPAAPSGEPGPVADAASATEEPNPPHTTTGKITAPKFGSAGSGGLEYEGNFPVD